MIVASRRAACIQTSPAPTVIASRRLPLYLYGRRPTTVNLDGPALRIDSEGQAAKRYPLIRIARIICGQRVQWQSNALIACQQQQLPIVFVDGSGVASGYLQPAQAKPARLDSIIEQFIDRPDWRPHYRSWLRSERMGILQDWRRQRQAQGHDLSDAAFAEQVRQHVYHAETAQMLFPIASIQAGALHAYTLQTLHHAGLQPRYFGDRGQALELAADIANLLGLLLQLETIGIGCRMQADATTSLHVLHHCNEQLLTRMPRILGRLHRCFLTRLERWH